MKVEVEVTQKLVEAAEGLGITTEEMAQRMMDATIKIEKTPIGGGVAARRAPGRWCGQKAPTRSSRPTPTCRSPGFLPTASSWPGSALGRQGWLALHGRSVTDFGGRTQSCASPLPRRGQRNDSATVHRETTLQLRQKSRCLHQHRTGRGEPYHPALLGLRRWAHRVLEGPMDPMQGGPRC